MSTKTISVRVEAYERLKRAKRDPSESFSDVILRARWDASPTTAADYLGVVRERGPLYRPEELAGVEAIKGEDQPPKDKWTAG
ncbi:MAG: antitoxin VapB family protein [Gemmatimonadetes bacterium]|nr:antitoxin VapB family protein [Gemmatimonadota bacterium]